MCFKLYFTNLWPDDLDLWLENKLGCNKGILQNKCMKIHKCGCSSPEKSPFSYPVYLLIKYIYVFTKVKIPNNLTILNALTIDMV